MSKERKILNTRISKIKKELESDLLLAENIDKELQYLYDSIEKIENDILKLEAKEFLVQLNIGNLSDELFNLEQL